MPSAHDASPPGPIAGSLVAAYRATDYVVDAPDGPIRLRVDTASEPLAVLMRALHVDRAALLTAHNPWSVPTVAEANDAAQRALEAMLAERGVPMLPARGCDPGGAWPPEASVLAFGLERDAADALARRFRQNAYLWIDRPQAPCTLVLMRPSGERSAAAPIAASVTTGSGPSR